MLTVACGQGRRSAASLDLDCFIAATATRNPRRLDVSAAYLTASQRPSSNAPSL
jgi:hypothetical protein